MHHSFQAIVPWESTRLSYSCAAYFFVHSECISKDYTVLEGRGGSTGKDLICSDQTDHSIEHFAVMNILLPFPS